jgi:hypothetical protein
MRPNYERLISGLRAEFAHPQDGRHRLVQKERHLCLLLVACYSEARHLPSWPPFSSWPFPQSILLTKPFRVRCKQAVSDTYRRGCFSHRHASRQLAMPLASCKGKDVMAGGGQPWRASDSNSGLLGFSLELYTYTMLCNIGGVNRASTESLADVFVIPMEDMARFPTSGTLFRRHPRPVPAHPRDLCPCGEAAC